MNRRPKVLRKMLGRPVIVLNGYDPEVPGRYGPF